MNLASSTAKRDGLEAIGGRPGPRDPTSNPSPAALHLERLDGRAMVGHQTAWAGLCARAIEPNVFLEPAFALPLIQHIAASDRPDFLLAWEENGPATFGRLVGLLPLTLPRSPLLPIADGFQNKQVSLGTPLFDRDRGAEALSAMLAWLGTAYPRLAALRFTIIDKDGPFRALLDGVCRGNRALMELETRERATLRPSTPGEAGTVTCLTSAKRRKEMLRKHRRLSEKGVRRYSSARSAEDVAMATEQFLALEHKGWKGERGTALLADPSLATFTRSMTRLMSHEGKCRIDSLEIDGVAVAMGIVLTVGQRAHFWKTTFNEAYATLSPGVQFTLDLTQAQLAEPTVGLTDSCAVPDHPMINRLWPDRMTVADILVDTRPDKPVRFARAERIERLRRATKARLKSIKIFVRRRHNH